MIMIKYLCNELKDVDFNSWKDHFLSYDNMYKSKSLKQLLKKYFVGVMWTDYYFSGDLYPWKEILQIFGQRLGRPLILFT